VYNDNLLKDLDAKIDAWRMRDKDDDDRKVMDEVFDLPTLKLFNKLISNKRLGTLDFPVSTGKEGKVFHGTGVEGEALAVKVYRISNTTFRSISNYIIGDPRFKGLERNYSKLIYTWATKEFKNLKRLEHADVPSPKAVAHLKNILIMEFIGDETGAAPQLRNVELDDYDEFFGLVWDAVEKMVVGARLIHGDLSEYNILVKDGKPVIIDLGQGVVSDHPMAVEWLKRDVTNLSKYFRKKGVLADADTLVKGLLEEV